MKINDVLESFNKALDVLGNPRRLHYVAHSSWERKIGSVKSATTIITLIDPQDKPKEVLREECTDSVPAGQEEVLIERSQKKALTEFIIRWSNDTGT